MSWEVKPPVEGPVDRPLSAPENWEEPPDNDHARRAVAFIQSCPHTKGALAEEKKTLGDTWLPWQDKLTRHLFGTVDEDGFRRYTHVYSEQPKKAGKSHWMAAVMLYLLGPATKPGAELFSAAYDHGQAMIVWGIARQMCKYAGWEGDKVRISDYQGCWEIENPKADSMYVPLTRKAASKHGVNPYAVAFDELHEQPDRTMWDTLDDSMGAWREPLMCAITNSGHDRTSLCYQQRQYATENNADPFDDTFLGVVYGLEEDFEGVGGPDDWRRANPGVPVTVDIEKLRSKARTASHQPSKLNAFQRWQLGLWTRSVTRWLDPESWKTAREEIDWTDWKGAPCYGGLDLGSVSDLTAWLLVFPDPEDPELVRVKCEAWAPGQTLRDESNPHRDNYMAWERAGWLRTTPGRVTDYSDVKRQVREDADTLDLVDMAVDAAFQGNQLIVDLLDDGLEVAAMRTTYTDMTDPCNELERRLLMDPPKIRHDGNPVLAWAIQNVALKAPDPDRKRPVKDTEEAKIDPVVALLMALARSMRHETTGGSVYNEKELVVL